MKLNSYRLLFRIFSFLSDKTNGASFFVKYKLMLGTLIIGLVGSSASCKSKKQVVCYDVNVEPDISQPTCYLQVNEDIVLSTEVNITGNITDKSGEPAVGATINIKGAQKTAITDIDGKFTLTANLNDTLIISLIGFNSQELSVSDINSKKTILLESEEIEPIVVIPPTVTCYKVAVMPPISNNTEREIKGTITDQSGEPIIGVTIQIKKTTNGTITNENGEFRLKVKPKDILKLSYIGYIPLEITASNFKDDMTIVMEEDEMILCYEVVVVPYSDNDPIYSRTPKMVTKLPYNEVQQPPVPPFGNLDTFKKWIEDNIQYKIKEKNAEGELIISFAIDKNGKIVDKKILVKLSPDADKEALRVLSSSKDWQPGIHDGKPIKTTMTISVNFSVKK